MGTYGSGDDRRGGAGDGPFIGSDGAKRVNRASKRVGDGPFSLNDEPFGCIVAYKRVNGAYPPYQWSIQKSHRWVRYMHRWIQKSHRCIASISTEHTKESTDYTEESAMHTKESTMGSSYASLTLSYGPIHLLNALMQPKGASLKQGEAPMG